MKRILNRWDVRNLTLHGKILVINTLIASLFVYLMQVEEDPSPEIIKMYDKEVINFIWKGKKSKVPYDQLKAEKQEGGLKLVDLMARNVAIKVSWLFRDTEYVKAQLNECTPEGLGEYFWECNLNKNDVQKWLKKREVNPFWCCVVQGWFSLLQEHRTQNKIVPTHIWFNSQIRIGNQVVFYPKANQCGIRYVGDLMQDDRFLTHEELNIKFPQALTDMQYNSLKTAIPRMLVQNKNPTNDSLYVQMKYAKNRTAKAYGIMINKYGVELEKAVSKFHKIIPVNSKEYQDAFINIQKVTNVTKYRDFQYTVADPGFPRRGGANPRGGGANILFDQFFPKTA